MYKNQNKDYIFIEHIASGKMFELTKKSFDNAHLLKEIDTILYMGIVLWQEEWWFSGIFYSADFDADLILDEKNSLESRRAVNFLNKSTNVTETLSLQYKAFLEFNNGSPIAFMPASEVNNYTREYVAYFNQTLNLSKKEKKESLARAKKEGFFGSTTNEIFDFEEDFESALVFFNQKCGVEIAFEIASAFPLKENKYFNPKKTKEHVLRLFMSEEFSTELVLFCVDNFKHELSFFKQEEGQFILKDLDFLLRFFKGNNYHTISQITFTG